MSGFGEIQVLLIKWKDETVPRVVNRNKTIIEHEVRGPTEKYHENVSMTNHVRSSVSSNSTQSLALENAFGWYIRCGPQREMTSLHSLHRRMCFERAREYEIIENRM